LPVLIVAIAVVFAAYVRLRVAGVPLERDEGEYAYAGQLILQGVPPYVLAYNMKFPGTYYMYSVLMLVFGQTAWGIHVGLLCVSTVSTALLFALGRRVAGVWVAAAAASLFAIFTVDRWLMGVFAHATHFVVLFALAGLWQLDRALESRSARSFVIAGVSFGLAILMKQPGAAFFVLAIALIVWHDRRAAGRPLREAVRPIALLTAGGALPFAALLAVLWWNGALGKFWFWTFEYARAYATQTPLSAATAMLAYALKIVGQAAWPFWVLAGAGFLLLRLVAWPKKTRVWLTALALVSTLAILPGYVFRQHYFLLVAPAAALLAGIALVSIGRLAALALPRVAANGLAVVLGLTIAGSYVMTEREYLFSMTDTELSRSLYDVNPFVEAPAIGAYLREHTAPTDRIGVLGSEPELLFYAQRTSASGHIYTYPFFEPQPYAKEMAAEMVSEIESAQPPYIVYVATASSWTTVSQARNNPEVRAWAKSFSSSCYDVVGIADISRTGTSMVWDAEAAGYQPSGTSIVYVMRRKATGCSAAR
jgi:hypothetical protein